MKREFALSSLARRTARAQVGESLGEQDGLTPPAWVAGFTAGPGRQHRVRAPHLPATLWVSERCGRDATLVSVTLEGSEVDASAAFHPLVMEVHTAAFARLRASPHPHAVRIWNFLPGISDPIGTGVNRYMAFNVARHDAFVQLFGKTSVRAGALPTASCVGHGGASISIHVLGTATDGCALESPRQTPAFLYSAKYGPRPPCFARATTCRFGGAAYLLVGGTASVRGEDSIHNGSRDAQLRETLTNLRALIAVADGHAPAHGALGDILASRVYYRRESDREWLHEALPPDFSRHARPELVRADICRDELLLEIELLVALGQTGAHDGPARMAPPA